MKATVPKVILITGVSSGIGAACAEYLSALGHKVYGTIRKDVNQTGSYNFIKMDITDEKSIQSGVKLIIEKEKRIDFLINNAGMGIAGPIEDCSMDDIQLQFDVNFFGLVRMCKAVIPFMKEQQGGTIINVSSLGGILGMPYQAYYCASKFAIEGFSETMHMELKQYKINTVLVEPGDIKTGFTGNRKIINKDKLDSPEFAQYKKSIEVIEKDENNGANPKIVAKLICNIVGKKRPGFRYTATTLEQKPVSLLKRILPYSLFEKIIASHYKV
jgi:short-subunit dehydrogenase